MTAHYRSLCILTTAWLALASAARGQRASTWRLFNMADGLPEPGCASVSITPQGNVLVRMMSTRQFAELNGYTVVTSAAPDSIVGRIGKSPSGQYWAVAPEGLEESRNGTWTLHPVPAIATEFARRRVPPPDIPLIPVKQGRVLFLLPDRLMEYSEGIEGPHTTVLRAAAQTAIGDFTGMIPAHDGGLWISGLRGLAKTPAPIRSLSPNDPWKEYVVPASMGIGDLAQPQADDLDGVTLVARPSSQPPEALVHFDGVSRWELLPGSAEPVRQAWRGPGGSTWGIAADSLWESQDQPAAMVENEDLPVRQFNDAAVEPGGAFWLATADGLFRYAPPLWRTPGPLRSSDAPVRCPVEDAEGRFWFLSGSGLERLETNSLREYRLPDGNPRALQAARALLVLKTGALVLDAGAGVCLEFRPAQGRFIALRPGEAGNRLRLLGPMGDGSVCLQRFASGGSDAGYRLESYDGARMQSLAVPDPGLDEPVSGMLAARNGDLWLGTQQSVAWYHGGSWRRFFSSDKTTPEDASAFVELPDGKIWCAATDRIWEFDGRGWSVVRAGLNRINSLLRARDGSIWVASNSGLHRFWQGAWIENGPEEGLPSPAVRELYEDHAGALWAATARGLSRFHPESDPDPPRTSVRRLADADRKLVEGASLNLLFSGTDKWKYTPADRLLFSYRLDQRDWSPFQNLNAVSLPDLAAGKHSFQVRALDRNGNRDPDPATLEFTVALPWYEETRLVMISLLGLAAALLAAALALSRHRQLRQSYAEVEQRIAERTRDLEIANRELLHSQKMNALGTLAAGIAHDFNNILSIIKGSAQIIEGNLDNPAKIRTRVDRIKTVVEQGAGIVQAMLGFSRSSDQQPSRCDLNAVVSDTVRLLGDRFLREVEVQFIAEPGLPEVAVPRDLVQQILLNFIFNAAESMTGRRHVQLAIRRLDRLPLELVLAPAESASGYVAISVRDSGCGIPPEILPRIFEPFFTTKALSIRRGTGLGLSMVYELARKIAAGIAVESVVDRGSAFTLILPMRDPSPKPADADPEARTATVRS